MNKPVLVLGAGGHAAVLIDMLRQLNYDILGLVSNSQPMLQPIFDGIPWYSSDSDVLSFSKDAILLVNAVGSLPKVNTRFKLYNKFKNQGYHFANLISPSAIVSEYAKLTEGVQVMPGSIINAHALIGENSIINTGAIIEHDCVIGSHNHIAPGAVLSGTVVTGNYVHVGTGANVIQGVSVAEYAVVGAGATVTNNLASEKVLHVAKPFLQ